jgi:hypothetical protein
MGQSKEHYNPKPMAANSSLDVGIAIAGFLCTVAGTLTVTDADGTVLVHALPSRRMAFSSEFHCFSQIQCWPSSDACRRRSRERCSRNKKGERE